MSDTSKKRGRPKGAVSFTRVKLSDLNRFLKEEAIVSVSRKYLEEIGLTLDESAAIIASQPEDSNQATIPDFTITQFDQ